MLLVAATMAMVPSTVASVDFVLAGEHDRAHHRDGVERIGQRHQRRVQQRRHLANHFEADERRQHEHVQAGEQIRRYLRIASFAPLAALRASAGNREEFAHPRIDHFAVVRHQRVADDFVFAG